MNDDVALARRLGADGVHLGTNDLPLLIGRTILPTGIVGLSTHSESQVDWAVAQRPDLKRQTKRTERMSQSEIQSQLSRTQQAIQQTAGVTPNLFRPPYGESNATLRAVDRTLSRFIRTTMEM